MTLLSGTCLASVVEANNADRIVNESNYIFIFENYNEIIN